MSKIRLFCLFLCTTICTYTSQSQELLCFSTDDLYHDIVFEEDYAWVSFRGGYAKINLETDEVTRFNNLNSNTISNYNAWMIQADDGTNWMLNFTQVGILEDGVFYPANINYPGQTLKLSHNSTKDCNSEGQLVAYYNNGPNDGIFLIDETEPPIQLLATNSNVYDLVVDQNDNIWFSEYSTLNYFDGTTTTIFNESNSTLSDDIGIRHISISDNNVLTVVQFGTGNDYEGTFVHFYDGQNWEVLDLNLDAQGIINVVHQEESTWFSSDETLYKFENGNLTTQPWPEGLPTYDSLYTNKELLAVDSDGNLWIRMHRMDSNTQLFQCKPDEIIGYILSNSNFTSNLTGNLYIDPNNNIWTNTSAGISSYNGLSWTNYVGEMYSPQRYPGAKQHDPNGNLWVALGHQNEPHHTFLVYDGVQWDPIVIESNYSDYINAVDLFFREDETIWSSTNYGMLYFDGTDWTMIDPTGDPSAETSMGGILEISDSTFYVIANTSITDSGIIYYFDGSTFSEIDLPFVGSYYFPSVYLDNDQNLWIYARNFPNGPVGIGIYSNGVYQEISDDFELFNAYSDMTQDANGIYWFVYFHTLYRYDEENWEIAYEFEDFAVQFQQIKVDSFNNLWLTSIQNGIYVFNENGIDNLGEYAGKCIKGHTYFDFNENGQEDELEARLPNQKIQLLPDSIIKFTSVLGNFEYQLQDTSQKIVEILPEPDWEISSPFSSYETYATEDCIDELDFGLTTTQTAPVGEVHISPGQPRCHEQSAMWLNVLNSGYVSFSGTVSLEIDELVNFISADPMPVDSIGNTYIWEVAELTPFMSTGIQLVLQYPDENSLGDTVYFNTILTDSFDEILDEDQAEQIIECSYDPNDKAASPQGPSVDNLSLIEDPIEYLIRFENTGNANANRVVIQDNLAHWLDISSFKLIGASHPVEVSIENRVAEFRFDPISLPYSSVDLVGSQGFVAFQIQPIANIPDETLIENTAFIYFDYNPPIVTNTTENVIVEALPVSVHEPILATECLAQFAPNPAYSSSQINVDPEFLGGRLELYDVTSKCCFIEKNISGTFNLHRQQLNAGIYFYRLIKDGKSCGGKLVFY